MLYPGCGSLAVNRGFPPVRSTSDCGRQTIVKLEMPKDKLLEASSQKCTQDLYFREKFYSYADLLQFWCDVMSPLHSSFKNYLPKWHKGMLGSRIRGWGKIVWVPPQVTKCSSSLATALHALIDYNMQLTLSQDLSKNTRFFLQEFPFTRPIRSQTSDWSHYHKICS